MGKITKSALESYVSTKREVRLLREEIAQAKTEVVADTVTGSGAEYPYVEHTVTVCGIDERRIERKRRRMERKERACERIEDFVDEIEDSEMRPLIEYHFLKGLNWPQTVRRTRCELSPDTARKKVDAFIKNL